MSVDIEVIATSASVFTKEALIVGLLDCSLELKSLVPELTSNVDVCCLGSHSKADNKSAFDKLVWIVSEDFSVFAGTWL